MSVSINHKDYSGFFPFYILREGIDFPTSDPAVLIPGYPAAVPLEKIVDWWWKVKQWTVVSTAALEGVDFTRPDGTRFIIDPNEFGIESDTIFSSTDISTNVRPVSGGAAIIPQNRTVFTPTTMEVMTPPDINGLNASDVLFQLFAPTFTSFAPPGAPGFSGFPPSTTLGPVIQRKDGKYYPFLWTSVFKDSSENSFTLPPPTPGTSRFNLPFILSSGAPPIPIIDPAQFSILTSTLDDISFPCWIASGYQDFPGGGSPPVWHRQGASGGFAITRTDW